MTHVLRIAFLRIALHVANPEGGKREGIHLIIALRHLIIEELDPSLQDD